MELICFSYAGGDGHNFKFLKKKFEELNIYIIPYSYRRSTKGSEEERHNSIREIAIEAATYIVENFGDKEYGLLGCSMGSIVVYEVYAQLKKKNHTLPKILYFCSALPPHRFMVDEYNDDSIIEELLNIGGVTEEIIDLPGFKDYFLPIIKHDFYLCHKYVSEEQYDKIDCKLFVVYGDEDKYSETAMREWTAYANEVEILKIHGGHFFLFDPKFDLKILFNK